MVFQLEGVPCATGRATHKYLATALGLDQFVYAVHLFCGHILTRALGRTAGDFAVEIGSELAYFASRLMCRRPPPPTTNKRNLAQAFGVEGYAPVGGGQRGGAYPFSVTPKGYDDDIRLMPYTGSRSHADAGSPELELDNIDKLGGSPRYV